MEEVENFDLTTIEGALGFAIKQEVTNLERRFANSQRTWSIMSKDEQVERLFEALVESYLDNKGAYYVYYGHDLSIIHKTYPTLKAFSKHLLSEGLNTY